MRSLLKWNKARKAELITVTKRKNIKCGLSCVFVKLNESVGAKIYSTQRERDRCHKIQTLASEHKIAPLVGDPFDLECYMIRHNGIEAAVNYRKMYGYLTQVAEIRRSMYHIKDILGLEYDLYKIGIIHDDLHKGNIGFIKDKMVCIDFDAISCKLKRGRKHGS